MFGRHGSALLRDLSYFQHPAVSEAGSMKDSSTDSTSFSAFKRSCIAGYRAVAFHRVQMSSVCWNFGTEQVFNKFHESNYNSPEPNDCKDGTLASDLSGHRQCTAQEVRNVWKCDPAQWSSFTDSLKKWVSSKSTAAGSSRRGHQAASGAVRPACHWLLSRWLLIGPDLGRRNPLGSISKWELPHLMAN